MEDLSKTHDPQTFRSPNQERALVPCAEILYHPNLDRIGWKTAPDLFGQSGRDVIFGRAEPDFIGDGTPEPLADPCISREQLTIAWLPEVLSFKITPPAQSKRPIGLVVLNDKQDNKHKRIVRIAKLTQTRLVEPGTCLAIGDRLLLWLDLRPSTDTDRMGLIGESNALWNLRQEIAQLARFQRAVLVQGETGTGKELVSRAIHTASDRGSKPLQTLNCGAIPEGLVESTLFGHKKGAFTGAGTDMVGIFEAANGSSLFLDEVGELPMSAQKKLLRVLQEGTITPVGAVAEQPVDVRVIAATNRNLESEVVAGRFREDLYFRLSAHRVQVPALRNHAEDIPRLFAHFFQIRREEHPELARLWRVADRFTPPAPMAFFLELLCAPWRGNVRQLQNLVEKTAQLNLHQGEMTLPKPSKQRVARTNNIATETTDPLPRARRETPSEGAQVRLLALSEALGLMPRTLDKLLPHEELTELMAQSSDTDLLRTRVSRNLQTVLERFGYRQGKVAEALSISRNTLHKLMAALGFPRPKDLTAAQILAAYTQTNHDTNATARALRVSRRGLVLRANELELELSP